MADEKYVRYTETDATLTSKLFEGPFVERMVKVTNFFEQANAAVPLFAEMCKRAKFADHGGYLTLELETDDSPEGKLICFVEAGDSLDELIQKTAIEWGEG